MLKAINLDPALLTIGFAGMDATEARDFITQPKSCDAVVTWAPAPATMGPVFWQGSWERSDAAVEFILSHNKHCFVAVPSSNIAVDGGPGTYAQRLKLVCATIDRYPDCSIIVSNEPAFAHVPAGDSAQLIQDAAEHAASSSGLKHVLGPAEATFWGTPHVLSHLLSWAPPKGVRVDVAVHHYYDLVNGGARQARTALAALKVLRNWRPNLYLTEGGFKYHTEHAPPPAPPWDPKNPANPATWAYTDMGAEEKLQLRRLPLHYQWCERQSRIGMWANYEYRDSLWGGWASGLIAHDGTPHPVAPVWPTL